MVGDGQENPLWREFGHGEDPLADASPQDRARKHVFDQVGLSDDDRGKGKHVMAQLAPCKV